VQTHLAEEEARCANFQSPRRISPGASNGHIAKASAKAARNGTIAPHRNSNAVERLSVRYDMKCCLAA
jgi:hypothetical protein